MNLQPEDIRSIKKIGPSLGIMLAVTIPICAVAFYVSGLSAAGNAWVISCLFWAAYIALFPNYQIKKMDGTEFIVKRGSIAKDEMDELRRRVKK